MENVFSGPNSIKEFLNPANGAPLPLVELPENLNPFAKQKVRIFAKMMNMLPLANVKSLPAYNMLLELERSGKLKDTHSIIESSSGNTAFSLAVIGRVFGIDKIRSIVSNEVGAGKLKLLQFFGNEIVINNEPICPDPSDKESGIYKAKQIGNQHGWINPGQYENEANPDSHFKWTGPQIWLQTSGEISIFCAGLGTTGTMVGVSKYLKSMGRNVVTVGVTRKVNNPVPGVRTINLLREIAFDWKGYVDHVEEVGTKESYKLSLELCRTGLVVGPSSGFPLAGLLQYLGRIDLDKFRNKNGEVIAVFICPDTPFPYIDEYFEYLDAEDFPAIENKELLPQQSTITITPLESKLESPKDIEIDCNVVYDTIYTVPEKELWKSIDQYAEHMTSGVRIIDVRKHSEFEDYHMPGAENIDYYEILDLLKKGDSGLHDKVFFVCTMGVRSKVLAIIAREQEIDAYSMKGGLIEWSRFNYPRARADNCVKRYHLKEIPNE